MMAFHGSVLPVLGGYSYQPLQPLLQVQANGKNSSQPIEIGPIG